MSITEAEWAVLSRGGRKARSMSAPAPTQRSCPSEDDEQIALIAWARLHIGTYPPLAGLFHVPNVRGSRHILEVIKLKRMGVLPGVPDLILLYPHNGFHGWCGEMKALDGKPEPAQRQMKKDLRALGYDAEIYYGWEAARDGLIRYVTGTNGDALTAVEKALGKR